MTAGARTDFIDFEDLVFKTKRNGHIECLECDGALIWCEHIAKLVAQNADAESLWERVEGSFFEFEIPIFPTVNMWAHVVLEPHVKTSAHRLCYYPPSTALTDADQLVKLGFVHPSEGRFVMRSMILDWFRGAIPGRVNLDCRSAGHKFSQQMKWEQAMKNEAERLKNWWSVWTTKACLFCQIADNSWDDLIPEDERRRPF